MKIIHFILGNLVFFGGCALFLQAFQSNSNETWIGTKKYRDYYQWLFVVTYLIGVFTIFTYADKLLRWILYSPLWVNTSRLAAEVFLRNRNIWIPGQARDDRRGVDTSQLAAGWFIKL